MSKDSVRQQKAWQYLHSLLSQGFWKRLALLFIIRVENTTYYNQSKTYLWTAPKICAVKYQSEQFRESILIKLGRRHVLLNSLLYGEWLLHTNINKKQNSAQQVFVLNNLLKVFSIYENQQGMVNENLNKTYFLNNIIFTSLNNKSKISIDNVCTYT